MKRHSTLFLFTLLTLTTVPAQADIIDDTIGNIQQAINDASNLTVGEIMKIRATTAGSVK